MSASSIVVFAHSVEERVLALQKRKRGSGDAMLALGASPIATERDIDDLFAPLG